ncbi:MAG: hypothetical protein V7651_17105 [Hyphomonas oceanitis]|uniref:hypothetical protein n=1 Tax=Hyphomonas oceanitis TaxID=81033 RepID=UPI003001BEE1
MAEFMRPKPEPVSGPDDGFNSFGKPIPLFRKQAAFTSDQHHHLRHPTHKPARIVITNQ